MLLHTVKTSPFQTLAISNCLDLLADGDTLLLIEDAVVASQADHPLYAQLKLLADQGRLMVLDADLEARGIQNRIGTRCSYLDFVALVIKHQSQLAW
ncbi:sulfurtransferase complex subunit TusB [Psychromonas antarctica]|jgi:tRNA 2-thiouridine synthesizing protein B|uniref:sulfurtransferase complex subunit TusB n=1 Tax=Psychromonas antarctica TaxID=67573 RepID=UPI001EE94B9D|nr:sulfurtransferase complex subunit TusB [Psychromonas antarctica]MCG6200270.1 sulfurtransferase complex subunit TusB [Psychromonas antarctica]